MSFLLDTNAVISVLRGGVGLIDRVRACRPDQVCISAIVAHELYFGAFRGVRRQANVALVDELRFPVVEFDVDDARMSGEIRASLSAAGATIGPYDVLIAGQALSRGLILITHDTREFSRVAGLRIEDWEA